MTLSTVFLFLVSIAIRMVNFTSVFPGNGSYYLFDPDCYIRLRKVQVYLAAFPKPFVYDYFQGFPHGTGIISAPIMEYLLAGLLLPFTGREIDERQLATIMAFIPPLLGGITVVLLFKLVKEWFGSTAGMTAAVMLAVMPVHIEATLLGRFDNEMTEPLMLVLVLLFYLRTYRSDATRNWLLVGLLQAIFVVLWRGALLPLAVIGLDILARSLLTKQRLKPLDSAAAYLLPAAIFSLICLTNLWGTRGLFSFNIVSWFHVLLFTLSGITVYLAGRSTGRNRSVLLPVALVITIVAISVPFLSTSLWQGLQVAGGGDVWIDSIEQYLPAYKDRTTIFSFGIVPILAPLAAWLALRSQRDPEVPLRFLMVSMLSFYLLALLRRRFGHFYAIEASMAAGMMVPWLQTMLASRFRLSAGSAMAAIFAALLLLQSPVSLALPILKSASSGPLRGDLEDALLWIRHQTPPAGDPCRPDIKPAYSVISNWDLGGYIETVARRPSVATSYGTETYGMEEAGRLFLSTGSAELAAVLQKNGSRYVLLYNPIDKIEMYTRLLKVRNDYVVDQWDPLRQRYAYQPRAEAMKLSVVRLFIADGSLVETGGLSFAPLEGVRLVFESITPADLGSLPLEVKQAKVFERVPGARVTLPAVAGCQVMGEQQVLTNQGRSFIYRNIGTAGGAGKVSVTLPYPPRTDAGSVGAVGPAVISCGDRNVTIDISAEAIQAGNTLMRHW